MKEMPEYPENRLDLCVDEQGNVTYRQNPVFAKYYAPTREEKEQELEDLKDRLELLELDEPMDVLSVEYEDWEAERNILEEEIEELEEEIEKM
jgi:hypothetical protein